LSCNWLLKFVDYRITTTQFKSNSWLIQTLHY